ncbi:MAG: division/cell wall cluster transcriptional repressor MraZ [Planctomycetales bacterium]|nr:division/cell wall cluster transcriptional repressor MraZ [Planctomycetales bacterium]
MLLTGSYRRSLDDKLRLAIPKQLRDPLGFPTNSELFIAPGNDGSLVLYTAELIKQIGEALSKLGPAEKDMRAFSRLFYSQAQPADIDRQGRLRIPPELAKLANLNNEVVVLGVRDRIELWNAESWDQFLQQTQPSYDELAERVLRNVVPNLETR